MPAISLPDAPSLNLSNPAVGAAEGAMHAASNAYAAGLQFTSALRNGQAQYAQQQQQAAAKQQIAVANQQAQLLKLGATQTGGGTTTVPGSQVSSGPGGPNLPGLKVRPGATQSDDAQNDAQMGQQTAAGAQQITPGIVGASPFRQPEAAAGPQSGAGQPSGQPFTDMSGGQWNIPSDAQRAKAKQVPLSDENSIVPTGKLQEFLGQFGLQDGQRVPYSHLGDWLKKGGLAKDEAPENQTVNATAFSEPVTVGQKTGTVKKVNLPDGVTAKPTTPKADSQEILHDRVGPNGGMLIYDKNTQKTIEIPMPEGSKTQLDPAHQEVANRFALGQSERDDRRNDAADTKAQGVRDRAQNVISQLQIKEDEQHKLRASYSAALQAKDDEEVVDPRSGKEVVMDPAQRRQMQTEYDGATKKAQSYYDSKQKLVGQHGGQTGNWKAETAAPAAPKAAAPAAAPVTPGPAAPQKAAPAAAVPAATPPAAAAPAPAAPKAAVPAATKPVMPKIGEVRNGYSYAGGDPALRSSWAKAK